MLHLAPCNQPLSPPYHHPSGPLTNPSLTHSLPRFSLCCVTHSFIIYTKVLNKQTFKNWTRSLWNSKACPQLPGLHPHYCLPTMYISDPHQRFSKPSIKMNSSFWHSRRTLLTFHLGIHVTLKMFCALTSVFMYEWMCAHGCLCVPFSRSQIPSGHNYTTVTF